MDAQIRLRQLIAAERDRLRRRIPADRRAAIVALVRAGDRLFLERTGFAERGAEGTVESRPVGIGWTTALALGLDGADRGDARAPDGWAEDVIRGCGRLGEAELVVRGSEMGHLRLQHDGGETFHAWPATRRMSPERREREDIAWWASSLAARVEPEIRALAADRARTRRHPRALADGRGVPPDPTAPDAAVDGFSHRLGALHVRRMAYQHGYPRDAAIGGCPVRLYLDLVARLIGWALAEIDVHDRPEETTDAAPSAMPRSETALVAALAAALPAEPALVRRVLDALILDRDNAGYHAVAPVSPAPPLVRVGPDGVIWSLRGLLTEPVLFLMRELKRRHGDEYHATAHLREDVFRRDLYGLFANRRFVTSARPVELKRDGGGLRTDLDALVFDRKTGTLGVFELKSHDPFARTTEERLRQRDNVLHANRQVAALLHWLKGNDPTSLLARFDASTAKRFRVHRVHVFVLGRYLAHFAESPVPDRRAAWGTWPQVLRLTGDRPVRSAEANPIGSLFAKLTNDDPLAAPPAAQATHDIPLGDVRIRVYPSFAAFKGGA